MKIRTVLYVVLGLFVAPLAGNFTVLAPHRALAAEGDQAEAIEAFTREELAQMLAPIALYPDTILSQVLIASTYPIEVIEADRWVKENPEIKWQALDEALVEVDWDPSVKALCHFPTVLDLMSQRIGETTRIGNAFLAQEEEVLDTIQELRAKAYAQGNLTTTPEQKVIVQKEKIIIEPAHSRVVYVPYYDTMYIYGPWWYPAYPPYYWGPGPRLSIGLGISFWPGFYFSTTYSSWCWPEWHDRYIYVDVAKRPRYVRHDRWRYVSSRWHHRPTHRRGLIYRDIPTARKYTTHPVRPERFRRDPRVFSAPRVQERLKNPRLNAPQVRDRRTRDAIRPQVDRNRPQRPIIERPTGRPSINRGDMAHRPRVHTPKQAPSRIRPESRQQPVEPPRSQNPSSGYGDRRQRAGVPSPNHVSPRIQRETQQRLRTLPGVQGTPRARVDRQANQRIRPETPRLLPGAQGSRGVQQPTPRREPTVRSRSGILDPQAHRGTPSRGYEGFGRNGFSGFRGGFTPGGSSRHSFDGHGR